MSQTVFEKLQLSDERNLLIQGLPSSIEKQFSKLSFAKNMTPLLKIRKIDFALVFAVNENQLNGILKDIMPSLKGESKFWVAYPKVTSKIVTDLNRCRWPNSSGNSAGRESRHAQRECLRGFHDSVTDDADRNKRRRRSGGKSDRDRLRDEV